MASVSKSYAADVIREMYGGSLPHEATRLLRAHGAAQARSSSAPVVQKWSTGLSDRPQERRRVDLKVPRVGQRKNAGGGLPPSVPGTGKKPLAQILLDTSNYERQEDPQPRGRDYEEEKRRHQDRCAFGFGNALPTVMEPRSLAGRPRQPPKPLPTKRHKLHVTFAASLPASREASPRRSGLTAEQEQMAAEIVDGVRARQQELETVEQVLAGSTVQAEEVGKGTDARRRLLRQMEGQSKRRLELKNAIAKDIGDLEKLMDLSPED